MAEKKKKYTTPEFQGLVLTQFNSLHVEISDIRKRIDIQTGEIKEIKEILYPLAKAFDIDTQTLVSHGRRIGRLEKHIGFT